MVANLGHNTTNRKLNRKSIESVNVPRACGTIEKPPGAPLALRLQGSLLYGVSGVCSKQSTYLLDDTEKMWARMRTYFREVQTTTANQIDPNAGKYRQASEEGKNHLLQLIHQQAKATDAWRRPILRNRPHSASS